MDMQTLRNCISDEVGQPVVITFRVRVGGKKETVAVQ